MVRKPCDDSAGCELVLPRAEIRHSEQSADLVDADVLRLADGLLNVLLADVLEEFRIDGAREITVTRMFSGETSSRGPSDKARTANLVAE